MRSWKMVVILAAAALASSPVLVTAQQPSPRDDKATTRENRGGTKADKQLKSGDRKFMNSALQDNMAEVELGRLANERGGNDRVKQFGQRMVDDHTKATTELTQLAQQKGVAGPEPDGKHKQLRDRMSRLSGAEFDRAYANEMVKEHKKDVAAFRKQADRGGDADVKTWAAKTLQTLKEHLRLAREMETAVKGTTARSTGR